MPENTLTFSKRDRRRTGSRTISRLRKNLDRLKFMPKTGFTVFPAKAGIHSLPALRIYGRNDDVGASLAFFRTLLGPFGSTTLIRPQ
jgi:hypothetical protein